MSNDKGSWLTGYQSFGIHGLNNYPVVADYPLELKRSIVSEAMASKFEILAQLRAERNYHRERDLASKRIQRAFRRRPKGVDRLINNKTALGLRP